MSKQLVFSIIFCILGVLCSRAQTVSSVEEQYSAERCMNAPIVCINPNDNNATVICYNDSSSYRPCFVYHSHTGAGASRKFRWPDVANTFGSISYKVNDMMIDGDYCYYCGKKETLTGVEYTTTGQMIPTYTATGFFGWVSMSQMSSSAITVLDLYLFDLPIDELIRMDGVPVSGSMLLGLISGHTLALVKGNGSTWACHFQDVTSAERLEDVKMTMNHLVTLSSFANGPYSFGLRCETKADAFRATTTHTLVNYYDGRKYNTLPMTTASLPNVSPTKHYEHGAMRMANHPYSDILTVAYDGCYTDGGDCRHYGLFTPMYLMNFSNCSSGYVSISMDNAQLITTTLLKPAQYTLLEMCYVATGNTIALLHGMETEEYGMWSILQSPSWIATTKLSSLQSDYRALKSMDVGSNGWTYWAGWRMPDKALLHFRQDGSMLERTCYSTHPPAAKEVLSLEAEEEIVTASPSIIPVFTLTQTHYQATATTLDYYPECTTSY